MRRGACALVFALALGIGAARAADGPVDVAQEQFNAGNYPAAIRTLHAALSPTTQQGAIYYWLARCYFELRDYKNAVVQAEHAVKLDSQKSDYHLWLGRAYGRRAEYERSFWLARKSKREFEEAVRLDPRNIPARRDLMEFCATAPWIVGGSNDEARQQVEAIAALEPLEGDLARGEYLKDLKKYDLAEAEYRKLLELKPNRASPYFEVADFYARVNKPAQMEEAVEMAARIDRSDVRLNFYRGAVRVLAGNRLGEAEPYLKSYLATAPQRSDLPSRGAAREWLGRLYEREGKRLEAAEQYSAALQLDPDLGYARESLQRLRKQSN